MWPAVIMEKNGEQFMGDLSGAVRVFKRIRKNPVWQKDAACYGRAWIDLLLLAVDRASAPQRFWVRGIEVTLERGQVGWSQKRLAEEWGRSGEWVTAFLKWCQDQGMIQVRTTNTGSVITIVNYDAYQIDEEPGAESDSETDAEPGAITGAEPRAETAPETDAEPGAKPEHKGKRVRVSSKGKGVSAVPPEGSGTGLEAATAAGARARVLPTDEEVAEFCAGFQDLSRGVAGIPEGWWRGWLAHALGSGRVWPVDWQRALKNAFLADFANRHPKATGGGAGLGARGAGTEGAKNAGKMAGGQTEAQWRFKLDRELEQIRERMDACYETNVQPDPADVAREKEIETELRGVDVQTAGRNA